MAAATFAAGGPADGGAEARLSPPRLCLTLAEGRGVWELAGLYAARPLMMTAPKGDGHSVLVLPGFLASDRSTQPMRDYFTALGYDAHGWGFGQNLGRFYAMRGRIADALKRLADRSGATVTVVGWSLGGVFARYLALTEPEAVRQVVTMGSPFAVDVDASRAKGLYEALSKEGPPRPSDLAALAGDLPVANTSIYTKLDGIVNWRTSIPNPAPNAEAIEIRLASHIGLGVNPAALWVVADRLAQREGQFLPFRRGGPFALAYGFNAS